MFQQINWTEEKTQQLLSLYQNYSREEIGKIMGLREGQIRAKLYRLGMNTKKAADWNDKEIEVLKEAYAGKKFSEEINLPDLAKTLNRHKTNVSRKARELGLTNISRPVKAVRKIRVAKYKTDEERRAASSLSVKEWHKKNPHPRGMAGKKHTPETLEIISAHSKRNWESLSSQQKQDMIMKSLKARQKNGTLAPPRKGTTWKSGWYEVAGRRMYFRSLWEYNYAQILEKRKNFKIISDWQYEPDTFWFEAIRRGTRSYTPDFKVTWPNGDIEYHEIKGWMDNRSLTKIKRMAKYHPDVKLIVIREKEYKAILKRGI